MNTKTRSWFIRQIKEARLKSKEKGKNRFRDRFLSEPDVETHHDDEADDGTPGRQFAVAAEKQWRRMLPGQHS